MKKYLTSRENVGIVETQSNYQSYIARGMKSLQGGIQMNIINELTLTFTIGFIFALFCGMQLEKSIKKAGLLNQHTKNLSRKYYHIKGEQSMNIGDIVYAVDLYRGSYIAEVAGFRRSPAETIQVRILACLSYPRQYAQLFQDKIVERYPYPYASIQSYTNDCIGKWAGDVPEYAQSIRNALNTAVKKCQPLELPVILRHLNTKEGASVCAGY